MLTFEEGLNQFKNEVQSLKKSKVMLLKGNMGMGKSELINQLESHVINNGFISMRITANHQHSFPFEPVISALESLLSKKMNLGNSELKLAADFFVELVNTKRKIELEQIKNGIHYSEEPKRSLNNGFTFSEQLKYIMAELARKSTFSVWFIEGTEYFDPSLLQYLKEFMVHSLKKFETTKVLFVIETNPDVLYDFPELKKWHYEISSYSEQTISLSKLDFDQIDIFISEQWGRHAISPAIIQKIQSISEGNPKLIRLTIGALISNNLLIKSNDIWVCKDFDEMSLIDLVRDHIQMRFRLLQEPMQQVIKKAAVIGFDINNLLLYKPFQIIKADEILQKIEALSNLIIKDNYRFSFENRATFQVIQEMINEQDKKEWHSLLANFLEKAYKTSVEEFYERYQLSEIAYHYREIREYEKSYEYYNLLIHLHLGIADYLNARVYLERAADVAEVIDISRKEKVDIYFHLAICNKNLSCYSQAIQWFEKAKISTPSANTWRYDYHIADCYYSLGEPESSYDILNKLILNSKPDNPEFEIKVASLLASIYEWFGDIKSSRQLYSKALGLCKDSNYLDEYYRIRRKENMNTDFNVCENRMKEVLDYFQVKGNIKEVAKVLHNMGTEYTFSLNFDKAREDLSRSKDLFRDFFSIDANYPLNSLGILELIESNAPEKALEWFNHAEDQENELFLKVCLLLNKSTCYRLLGNLEASKSLLEESRLILNENSKRKDISLLLRNFQIHEGLWYVSAREFDDAYPIFIKTSENLNCTSIENYTQVIIAKNIERICVEIDQKVPRGIKKFTKTTNQASKRIASLNFMPCDIMFWD